MNIIKPKKLNIGDKITIIAPSGPVDYEKIIIAKEYFENKGYLVNLGKNIQAKFNYLAGKDEERLEDIHNAFTDKETKAIICARGGYGALHLIDKIDYELIKQNPKIFCGYSDITILNAMFFKKANLITFSGPMAQSDFGNDICNITEKSFFETVGNKVLEISPNNSKIYNYKDFSGVLIGGNLTTFASLCGQDFIPDTEFILFAEDLNEPVYKIDRYFTQLLSIKKFKNNLKGILLGDFLDIDNQKYFEDLLTKLSNEYNIPIITGYQISHSKTKLTIPYGATCEVIDSKIKIRDYLS